MSAEESSSTKTRKSGSWLVFLMAIGLILGMIALKLLLDLLLKGK